MINGATKVTCFWMVHGKVKKRAHSWV